MDKFKKLPETEFEIMKVVWSKEPPVTTNTIMKQLGNEKDWKIQTVVSLMKRLIERGFLGSEKAGKERQYYPLITRDEYLQMETGNFFRQYHDGSVLNLINTLYDGDTVTDDDIEELLKWAEDRRG